MSGARRFHSSCYSGSETGTVCFCVFYMAAPFFAEHMAMYAVHSIHDKTRAGSHACAVMDFHFLHNNI